jgi:high-affinity iron transporter
MRWPRRNGVAARAVVAALAATFAAGLLAAPSDADKAPTEAPWKAAEEIRQALFSAQTAFVLDEPAKESITPARRALETSLAPTLRRADPAALREARAALTRAEHAFASQDESQLAAARGEMTAALRRGAYTVTLEATRDGDVATARQWLLVRDFRESTRFTRPGVDATAALDALEAGDIEPVAAAVQVKKDLLDAYQARLRDYLSEAEGELERGFGPALAESAALVRGYWLILDSEYERQRSAAERTAADADFAALEGAAITGDAARFEQAREQVARDLDGFTAAPFTPEEEARRAQQLIRFLDLVPIEYDHGTEDGHVTIPFELQGEMLAFIDAAESGLDDLAGSLEERDPSVVSEVEHSLDQLRGIADDALEGRSVASQEEVDAIHGEASDALDAAMPDEWKESSDEADFDLVDIALDQMEAAVSAGQYAQAEQARLSAYAFFEFGPEIKLNAFDPQLVTEVEGLVWYGARGVDGLGELIAGGADSREIHDTRLVLDEALEEARARTGEGANTATVITNAATIVFREGLEAILIIAAITASMVGANRRLRRPVLRGALLALPATAVLFTLAVLLLDSLAQYGEKVEAVVGLVAIGVLLLVLNWFFHRVYWTEWIAGHRRRGMKLAGTAATAGAGAMTVAGLYLLGFSSVFREGFETTLFLQALQLSSGIGVVLAGVTLGLIATAAIGAITFTLERRLPYKKMLIVTGAMIALVLVVMVGTTVRVMQGVGWLPITPIEADVPLWMGTWLGIFPTVEGIAAQGVALLFVVGSYYAAEWWRKRKVHKTLAALDEDTEPERAEPEREPAAGDGRVPAFTRVDLNGSRNGQSKRTPAGTHAGSGGSTPPSD